MSHNRLREGKTKYTNIAYERIQDRRSNKLVPCGAGGSLHDYVPFYFAPRSPMLYTINRGNVEGYSQGQQQILHLVTTAESVSDRGLAYVYTDGHAVMEYSDFFDDLDFLHQYPIIDWELMESRYWFDTEEDPDRKRRRQAEFLVYHFFPWHLVTDIGVIDSTIQAQVRSLLLKSVHKLNVLVRRDWYY
jgi:hypothetical protein